MPHKPAKRTWLSANQVADALEISTQSLNRWAKSGALDEYADELYEPTLGGHRHWKATAPERLRQLARLFAQDGRSRPRTSTA